MESKIEICVPLVHLNFKSCRLHCWRAMHLNFMQDKHHNLKTKSVKSSNVCHLLSTCTPKKLWVLYHFLFWIFIMATLPAKPMLSILESAWWKKMMEKNYKIWNFSDPSISDRGQHCLYYKGIKKSCKQRKHGDTRGWVWMGFVKKEGRNQTYIVDQSVFHRGRQWE